MRSFAFIIFIAFSQVELLSEQHSTGWMHRSSQEGLRGHGPQIFRTYSHVLWEAVSQTKYWYSPKIKHFDPQSFWPGYATGWMSSGSV